MGNRGGRRWPLLAILLLAVALGGPDAARAGRPRHEPPGYQLFASPQSNPIALSPDGSRLYVANTENDTVSVIDTASRTRLADIPVGMDPVSVAVRPDGREVWVANHVSDSVSVIDTDPASVTFQQVVETVQSLDANDVTQFDEPVGVAFASNTKAYVALSSHNLIAIVDASTYQVTGSIDITAQDPRAITVRGGRLYVVAFESGNQSALSVCDQAVSGDPNCTLTPSDLQNVATSPNLPGVPKNVVIDPNAPDRDLFVFDTTTDQPVAGSPVLHVGTLLYGLAVASDGRVFVTNTDARNNNLDGNGLAAAPPNGQGQGLADLGNRLFRNRITRVGCSPSCGTASPFDLEPGPGSPVPVPLATPYGVAISADDSTLVVTAAASSRVATVDTGSMAVLHTLDVGAIPRGVAFRSVSGAGGTAYVLNTLGDSVSVVNVGQDRSLVLQATIGLPDSTPLNTRLGRIAFESAAGSSSGTFACASCHPDGNIDQLLWVIGATCTLSGCDQEEQRITMPVRGLRHTVPLHWDGTLGDPFGGPNGEVGPGGSAPANCSLGTDGDEQECFRQLVDAAEAGVMCDQSDGCAGGGTLSSTDRDNMATFLQGVSYPPARSRRLDDTITLSARRGFADFFMDQGGQGGTVANTCADTTGGCHALPLGVSTNSPVVGAFEAPTMRGMTDRFQQFSGGFTSAPNLLNAVSSQTQFGVIPWDPAQGFDEKVVFSAAFTAFQPIYNVFPDDMFEMFEEASVGHSGAIGRQVSLTTSTTNGTQGSATEALLVALEAADTRGGVNLRGNGLFAGSPVVLSFDNGTWKVGTSVNLTHAQLFADAQTGELVATVTARLPQYAGSAHFRQPLIFTATTGQGSTGDPPLPVISTKNADPAAFTVGVIDAMSGARVLIDGQPVAATLTCVNGAFDPYCTSFEGETLSVDLAALPASGTRLLQIQNPSSLLSDEMPICVGSTSGCLQP